MDTPLPASRKKRKRVIRAMLLLAVCIPFVVFVFLRKPSAGFRVDREELLLAKVVKAPFVETVLLNSKVQPAQIQLVEALESGAVARVLAGNGQWVHKGDVLAELKNEQLNPVQNNENENYAMLTSELNEQLIQLKLQDLNDKQLLLENRQLEDQRRKLEKTERLYRLGGVSEEEYLMLKSGYETSVQMKKIKMEKMALEASVRESKRHTIRLRMQSIRQQLQNLRVRASVSGMLQNFNPVTGQSVTKGQSLGQLVRNEDLELVAEVDENYISRIRLNAPVQLLNEDQLSIKVRRVDYQINEKGQFKLYFAVNNRKNLTLIPGKGYAVKLELSKAREALQIPTGAFFQSTNGLWIYVLSPDGKRAFRRTIQLGSQNEHSYEVVRGLKPDETVVISDYSSMAGASDLIINN